MAKITLYTKQATGTHNRVSNYAGVSWNRQAQMWKSSVSHKGIKYECGYYHDDREAAKARDRKIIALGFKKPLQVLKRV